MNEWKQYKTDIKNRFNKAIPVYELDYSHTFFKISNNVVYDMNDQAFYCPQTGNF